MKLKITGGTDKDGIPMRFDIQGGAKKRAMLSGGVGFKPNDRGERRRKLVRGRVVGEDTMQINSVVMAEAVPAAPKTPAPEKKAEPAKPAQRPVEAKS